MKFTKSAVVVSIWSKIQMPTLLLLVVFLSFSCSPVNIEAAKSLSSTGRDTASQMRQNVLVSDKEYLRARDSVAFQNGFSGTTNTNNYKLFLGSYDKVYIELTQRAVVFERLADLYDAFGELAGLDAGGQTEKALGELGGAVEAYAKAINRQSPVSSDTTAVISRIGGLLAREVQKAKIKKASEQIQKRVKDFQVLFKDPLIRSQMIGFRTAAASDRKAAFDVLWDLGVYDPKPVLDDFGADAGLAAQKDVATLIKSNPALGRALKEVIDKRFSRNQLELVEKGYERSLNALDGLISEHDKLENGVPLDLAHLRAIITELRGIAVLLAKDKTNLPVIQ